MKVVGIIRERGQLTIPDKIRDTARWTSTSSVVSITFEKPDEILITPHSVLNQFNWEKLFELIKRSRAVKGKGSISSGQFIANDRS